MNDDSEIPACSAEWEIMLLDKTCLANCRIAVAGRISISSCHVLSPSAVVYDRSETLSVSIGHEIFNGWSAKVPSWLSLSRVWTSRVGNASLDAETAMGRQAQEKTVMWIRRISNNGWWIIIRTW